MAEIKNSFLKSKMNKDLDDRLIPNGEYRDAQNISVGKSEADDIGALENVLGNTLVPDTDLGINNLEIIGHYEDDGRDEIMLDLLKSDINFKLYGQKWFLSPHYEEICQLNNGVEPLFDDYNLALNSSKIALVFLSKLNNDTYTRRCFEIPAAKTLMLSEFTEDLDSLFKKDQEAVYFQTHQELKNKIDHYLNNEDERTAIIEKAYQRLVNDGHEVTDRASEIIKTYKDLTA